MAALCFPSSSGARILLSSAAELRRSRIRSFPGSQGVVIFSEIAAISWVSEISGGWRFSRFSGFAERSRRSLCAGARAAMGSRQNREKAGPGQESVWDYPRPPRLEPVAERIRIEFNSKTIADTTAAFRVLETSHPPVYYIPQHDINMEYVKRASGSSFCEWKGNATYWTVSVDGRSAEKVAWSYEEPTSRFAPMKSYVAFYAAPMDACYVGDERAQPQPGSFYGGWVTSKVVGPFKGGPGSWGW